STSTTGNALIGLTTSSAPKPGPPVLRSHVPAHLTASPRSRSHWYVFRSFATLHITNISACFLVDDSSTERINTRQCHDQSTSRRCPRTKKGSDGCLCSSPTASGPITPKREPPNRKV
ncbi:unnamed protein product, partial [Ectocarpus sp. 8 AP-2014]